MAKTMVALHAPLAEPFASVTTKVRGHIPSVHTAWVSFDPVEHTELRKYLDSEGIDDLTDACNLAGALYHSRRVNPISVSAIR